MKQKGFATIFGLCLMLIVALIVKGIQESEANHAREVLNFEMEQALQNAAESGIVEASKRVKDKTFAAGKIWTDTKDFKQGEQIIPINIEVFGERGNIYVGNKAKAGIYFMSRAFMNSKFFGKNIYRRAYGYVLDADDEKKIYFMELP